MQGRVASQRRPRFLVEGADSQQPGRDEARSDLPGHRLEVIDAVDRSGGGELRVRIVFGSAFEGDSAAGMRAGTFVNFGRQQRGHLPARRFAYDGDAIWIDAKGFFLSADEVDRLSQVLDLF